MVLAVLLGLWAAPDGLAFYNPATGRWLNRDPIGERGGVNLHGFVGNDPLHRIDPDGRVTYEDCPPAAQQKIQPAIDEACRRIKSTAFGCCMVGSGLGRSFASKLNYLCASASYTVRCAREPHTPWGGIASGSYRLQTITVYYDFFMSDGGGWGDRACVMGHEMLHLTAYTPHAKWNRLFNRLHKCLGCTPYLQHR